MDYCLQGPSQSLFLVIYQLKHTQKSESTELLLNKMGSTLVGLKVKFPSFRMKLCVGKLSTPSSYTFLPMLHVSSLKHSGTTQLQCPSREIPPSVSSCLLVSFGQPRAWSRTIMKARLSRNLKTGQVCGTDRLLVLCAKGDDAGERTSDTPACHWRQLLLGSN